MMLSKLSLKNIKKSFKDYAIYFFTLILGVAIFYVFNAIDSQVVLLNVTSSTYEIIDLMVNMLSGVSVFVSFILGFLIIYASRFLIKRRKKEFGIYLTLGMSKRRISLILFLETLVIGILSLFVGLGIGIILSQLMSLFVANMFEADMTKFSFVFSTSACLKTLLYFGIMYLIVMIFNTISIGKCRLIDLLNGKKKSEEIKLKNPYLCVAVFIFAVIILARAYYMVTAGLSEMTDFDMIFIPIVLGSISTYLIFWSLSGLILKIVMSMKRIYYKGLNSFVLRQFSSKINTCVLSMTIICLMLFVTICVLSSSLSIRNSMKINLDKLAPADIELSKTIDHTYDTTNDYTDEQLAKMNKPVEDTLVAYGIDLDELLNDYITIDIYTTDELTFASSLGSKFAQIEEKYKYLTYYTKEDIISLSDYNKVAQFYGHDTYTLAEDEYMIVADFASTVELRNIALAEGETIDIFGAHLKPAYTSCQDGFVEMSSNHINEGLFVVPDEVLRSAPKHENFLIGNYKATKKEDKKKTEEIFLTLASRAPDDYYTPHLTTRLLIAEASTGLGALATFIGLYLGIVFLISSAAILALKELSESADNKERFRMIRKLGADERQINGALFKQTAIFFATPLTLAIIHSIFGMRFSALILEIFGTSGLVSSIVTTGVFLAIIYGTYFAITYFSSKNIIKEKI